MRLADFRDTAEAARWHAIDDAVMGGRSSSAMLPGDGSGTFAGVVSLERGGGFASVRRGDDPVDLSAFGAIELRVRGDGRAYKLNLRTTSDLDGVVHQAAFGTRPGTWITVVLGLEEFQPRFHGRPVAGVLDRARVASLGLLVSDRTAGPFRLELESILARRRDGPGPEIDDGVAG